MWLQVVAGQAEGYDAADLRVLADRALHAAARRQLASSSAVTRHSRHSHQALLVSSADLAQAEQGFQPAAAWGVGHLQVPLTFSAYSCCLGINLPVGQAEDKYAGKTRLCLAPDEPEALVITTVAYCWRSFIARYLTGL